MKISADLLKPNERAVVVNVGCERSLKNRLIEMGLTDGAEISLVKRAPFGDPIEFSVRGYRLAIRKSEAKMITVLTRGG